MTRNWCLLLGAVLWSLAGCCEQGPGSYGLDLSLPDGAARSGAVIFVVDGINAEIFHEMLTDGELPAIQKYFVDRGLYIRRVSVGTPSVTMANLTTLATGLAPGHHGVVGVNWFDRNQLIWRDYATMAQKNMLDGDYTAETVFQRFPAEATYSVFFQPHRGTTKFFENFLSNGPAFFFGMYMTMDCTTLSRLGQVAQFARARKAWPAVTVCYLVAPDFHAYRFGLTSEAYRTGLRHTDTQIGRIMVDFERAGLLDELVFIITSDHGMVNVTEHFALERFLRNECGLDLASQRLWENTVFESRLAVYRQYGAVMNCCGDRYAAISLRRPAGRDGQTVVYEPWTVRPTMEDLQAYPVDGGETIDLPARLLAQEAVFAVAMSAGPNRVTVMTAAGTVAFHQPAGPGGDITYHLLDGQDPLGWAQAVPQELLTGRPTSPRAWQEATGGRDFADAPMQLTAYFRSRRAGDIVVFAAENWDFKATNRAGHGGMLAEEMHVPLLITGPAVQPGLRLENASTVDLAPTILSLLGRPVPPGLDGEPIATVGSNLPTEALNMDGELGTLPQPE